MSHQTQTREYANLGKTTWRCDIELDDGNDPRAQQLAFAEYPNLGLAKAWVNRTMPTFWRQVEGRPWAEVRRGNYLDDSFQHDGENVRDASWEHDERSQWYAHLADDNATVDWQDDSS